MTSRSELIYHRLPVPVQEIGLAFKSGQINRRRYGGDFDQILAGYEQRSRWEADQIESHRLGRLKTMVRHAAANVPHYTTAPYRGLAEIETISDLESFPILTKDEVRSLGTRLHPTNDIGPRHFLVTSGTTGSPLVVPGTHRAEREQWAVWWRYRRWHGLDRRTWCGFFGGKPIAKGDGRTWRSDRGGRRVLFSSYHTAPEALDDAIEVIRGRRIPWIHGYPSVIALLAGRVAERDAGSLDVRWVTFGSENVLDDHRASCLEAFGVLPREHYGAAEMVSNISECPHGSLHIDEDFAVVEMIENRMVGTTLVNPAFPLIRYDTGDTAELSATGCDCGRPGRIVASLDGRLDDYLVLADGSRLGRLSVAVKGLEGVDGAQFVQSRPGAAELHLVAARTLTEEQMADAARQVESFAPAAIRIEPRQVPALTRTRAGKARLVIQEGQPPAE